MNDWLKNHFQSDEVPPKDILQSTYNSACLVINNPARFPKANRTVIMRLVEEMEASAEICNILD
jgi:hypothetical protein